MNISDIEQALLFGSQVVDSSGAQYTEGALSFITSYGNIFDGSGIGGTGSKSQDDFLDDMSQFLDPRLQQCKCNSIYVFY